MVPKRFMNMNVWIAAMWKRHTMHKMIESTTHEAIADKQMNQNRGWMFKIKNECWKWKEKKLKIERKKIGIQGSEYKYTLYDNYTSHHDIQTNRNVEIWKR